MFDYLGEDRGRTLDFDVECRPGGWYGGEFVTKVPTVISWKWIDETGLPRVAWVGESGLHAKVFEEEAEMIELFRVAFNQADMVTGHFIREFDLKTLVGACLRLGIPLLEDKLTQDTKLDLPKSSGISKSMENLSAMFEAEHQKIPMNTTLWLKANSFIPEFIEKAKERCIGDVIEHIELRERLLALGALASPQPWTATGTGRSGYHA